jgi:hypothetical protein
MKRLSTLTLLFAFLSLVFFLLLVFLRIPFVVYPLMSWQDALDILTPLALIPLYWLMYRGINNGRKSRAADVLFMVMASSWVMGQGMHLSANSINNLTGYLARDGVVDVTSTGLYTLINFYDELLSHYLWHIGVIGLASLLIYQSWHQPVEESTNWGLVITAGILYGFTCFCFFLEGNTLILGFPFVTIASLIILIGGRGKLAQQPILAFFFVSCLLSFLLFSGWGLYWGGFPEIMKVFQF